MQFSLVNFMTPKISFSLSRRIMCIPPSTLKNSSTDCSHPLPLPPLPAALHRHEFLQFVNAHRLPEPLSAGLAAVLDDVCLQAAALTDLLLPKLPTLCTELVTGAGRVQTAKGFRHPQSWAPVLFQLAGRQAGRLLLLALKTWWHLTHFQSVLFQISQSSNMPVSLCDGS